MNRLCCSLLIIAVLCGCGGSAAKDDVPGLSKECTEFLDGYEKYVDVYIALLQDYKTNPTDLSLMQRATQMATEAQAWGGKATPECKDVGAFMTRQAKIQAKLTKASFTL